MDKEAAVGVETMVGTGKMVENAIESDVVRVPATLFAGELNF